MKWCERWDSNPHGITTRTSNVLVYHSNTLASIFRIIPFPFFFVNCFFVSLAMRRPICYTKGNAEKAMVRFFVAPETLQSHALVLSGENARHARVLRLKEQEQLLLCDGQGQECLCQVVETSPDITLSVLERRPSRTEPAVEVRVYMAYPKADKLEHVIQKATELGAYEVVAFPSSRCISRPDEKSLKKKLERWQKIAISAAEQSGRGRIPQVTLLDSFSQALAHASTAQLPLRQPDGGTGGWPGAFRGSPSPGGRAAGLYPGEANSPLRNRTAVRPVRCDV